VTIFKVPSVTDIFSTGTSLATKNSARRTPPGIEIRTNTTSDRFEPLWREVVTKFFVNFANNAVQERLTALTMTTEKANLSRLNDVRNIVAQL
jgi:hypothetical protein